MDRYVSLHPPTEVLITINSKLLSKPFASRRRAAASPSTDDDSSLGSTSPPNSPSRAQYHEDDDDESQSIRLHEAPVSRLRQIHSEILITPPRRLQQQHFGDHHGVVSGMTFGSARVGADYGHTMMTTSRNEPAGNTLSSVKDDAGVTKLLAHPLDSLLLAGSSSTDGDDMPPSLSMRPRLRAYSDEKKSSTPPPSFAEGDIPAIIKSPTASCCTLPFEDEGSMDDVGRHGFYLSHRSGDEAETSSLDGQPRQRLGSIMSDRGDIPMVTHAHHASTTRQVEVRSHGGNAAAAEASLTKNCLLPEETDVMDSGRLVVSSSQPVRQKGTAGSSDDKWMYLLRRSLNGTQEQTGNLVPCIDLKTPPLVKSLDLDIGIPKGDVMLSLLNEAHSSSNRVKEAVWRSRTMRQKCDCHCASRTSAKTTERAHVAVQVEEGSFINSIQQIQEAAFRHLRQDEFDEAQLLYEGILQSYHKYQEHFLKHKGSKTDTQVEEGMTESKSYIGSVMHNVGIILLLQGKWQDAFAYLERATWNRSYGSRGDAGHISSLARSAVASYALDDVPGSFAKLEEALTLARTNTARLTDHHLLAEILNNLGCLSYQMNKIDRAMQLFEESLQVQTIATDHSLYIGSKFSSQKERLNTSITTANIGFLHLAIKDASKCIDFFESAVKDQQLLLRDADVSLISTIEHLVTAHLLVGDKTKAIQLLKRMLHMQCDALGANHALARSTANKIAMLKAAPGKICR